MTAFDTDILTEILLANTVFVERAAKIPVEEQAVPVVVVEEVFRGRLSVIRQAEAGKAKISVDRAYELFERTLNKLRQIKVLSYTAEAESRYQEWRQQKIRLSTHDLRIAATCVAHSATLATRNRKDFERVPELKVEFWS